MSTDEWNDSILDLRSGFMSPTPAAEDDAVLWLLGTIAALAVLGAVAAARALLRSPRMRARLRLLDLRVHWKTLPNLITALRLLLLPILVVLLAERAFVIAAALAIIVFASDAVDGALARRTGTVSTFGTWLDPVADRLAGVAVATGLAIGQAVPFEFLLVLLLPDLVLTGIAVTRYRGRPPISVTLLGKVRTTLLFTGLALVLAGMAAQQFAALDAVVDIGVGGGFALALLGLVAHYGAGVQYAVAMLRRRTTAQPVSL